MMTRLAEWMLARALPRGEVGESIRADLLQELEELRAAHPGRPYRLWYLWEAVKLAVHFNLYRLRERDPRNPRRLADVRRSDDFMGSVVQDLRFAFRTLRRRAVFSVVAVLTLGLGIGSATAMFSVIDAVLLRSVPFRHPERIVSIWNISEAVSESPGKLAQAWNRVPLTWTQYRALQANTTTFEDIAVHNEVEITLTGEGPAERVALGVASASLLRVLGIQPILGRWFVHSEEGTGESPAARVAVISYAMWKNRLGLDPEVLGKGVVFGGAPYTVIGVLPEGFRLRTLGMDEDIQGTRDAWIPISSSFAGDGNRLEAVGRLALGVTPEAALVEAQRILQAAGAEDVRVVARSEDETRGVRSPLLLLLTGSAILLLIGCANVATLSLGALYARRPELFTRAALGARRGRIVRQLLTESVLLGLVGTAVGAVVAVGVTETLVAMAPPVPHVEAVRVDVRALAFAAVIGILASVLFGTLPALSSARKTVAGMGEFARTVSAQRGGVERWLVFVEVALTVVLLVAGGLLGRSFQRLMAVDPGFEPQGLATVSVYFPGSGYPTDTVLVSAYGELLTAIRAIPGVTRASAVTRLPFPGDVFTGNLRLPGPGGEEVRVSAEQLYATSGYHETLGIPILAGDGFQTLPGNNTPWTILISENIARRYWPDGSAVGARLRCVGREAVVVGVVGDVKQNALGAEAHRAFYVPLQVLPHRELDLVARTEGNAASLAGRMRDVVRAFDPDIPIRRVSTLPDLIRQSTAEERYRVFLMGAFALLATALAAVGVFGVTARAVARRTREMGIRLCLGAEQKRLLASVLGDELITSLLGTLFGLVMAGAAARMFSSFLFGIQPFDPLTYGCVAGFLVLVVAVASYLPARRIATLDPARVLGAE